MAGGERLRWPRLHSAFVLIDRRARACFFYNGEPLIRFRLFLQLQIGPPGHLMNQGNSLFSEKRGFSRMLAEKAFENRLGRCYIICCTFVN